jgi:hypothetical protein
VADDNGLTVIIVLHSSEIYLVIHNILRIDYRFHKKLSAKTEQAFLKMFPVIGVSRRAGLALVLRKS